MADQSRRELSGIGDDRSGQASTVGTALLLVITLVGTGLIVTLGGSAIDSTQQSADISRAEHSMTMLDSRAAVVALEGSGSQSTQFSQPESGTFRVEEDAGRMTISHRNHTGMGHDETIYNGSLGAVVYENGETTVAYQGGGVWRANGNASRLVSPPEFHYRGSTLTLPVIQVTGSDSATGGSALITSTGGRAVFPDSGSEYDESADGTPKPYSNPIDNGTVTVTVQGDYYQGWAQYFRTRTDGNVSVDHANQTVTLELVAVDLVGEFRFPPDDEPIRIRNMAEDHAVNEFEVSLGEGSKGRGLNNIYFSFYIEDGNQEFEVMFYVPSGTSPKCNGGTLDTNGDHLVMDVYYYDDTGADHHAWSNGSVSIDEGPVRLQCDGGQVKLYADFTSDQQLTYGNFNTSNGEWEHDWGGDTADTVSFTQHDHDDDHPDNSFGSGETTSLNHLINHYFALFAPDMDLRYNQGTGKAKGKPGKPVDYQSSSGTLDYDATGSTKFITYLHISENEIRVEFRS